MARGLRWFLVVTSLVMVLAGTYAVVLGAPSLLEEGEFTPDVDSELRFFAVWYVAMGYLLLRATSDLPGAAPIVRVVGAAFFVAGCARALSWTTAGRPSTLPIVLMVVELVLPFVIIPWQAKVARAAPRLTAEGRGPLG